MRMRFILTVVFAVSSTIGSTLQAQNPVKWKFSSTAAGTNESVLQFSATIESGWHIYSLQDGPLPISFNFTSGETYELKDGLSESKPIKVFDSVLEKDLFVHEEDATFQQHVRLVNSKSAIVSGTIQYMACSSSMCLPPKKVEFQIEIVEHL